MAVPASWIVCQLGAREHYAIARELHRHGQLRALITDAWAPPHGLVRAMPGGLGRRLAERYTPGLEGARVEHFTAGLLGFELAARERRDTAGGWDRIMARNQWFETRAAGRMRARRLLDAPAPAVFAYSYAALDILRAARDAGCRTVLGQIDPAITEENIVAAAVEKHASLKPDWQRAPARYWARWREECDVADHIVVNSAWAREGLIDAGVDAAKLVVVPLAYEGTAVAVPRAMLPDFSSARPLRVLFLGSLVIRKGIAELFDAARLLADAPVEFHLVGHASIEVPADLATSPRIVRHGPVVRSAVAGHYAAADVFILPSLSDGFGLTQIEAQAHGLPVIASRCCGDVVRDGVDGLLLDEVSGPAIAASLRALLAAPDRFAAMGEAARRNLVRFTPDHFTRQLDALLS